MRAGSLRETITIMAPATGTLDDGSPNLGYTEVFTTRASYQPIKGREFYEAQQLQSEIEVKFSLRFRDGILPKYIIRHRGIDYEIVGPPIDVDGTRRELLCYCKRLTQ